MAHKQLNASVRLDARQAEQKLRNIAKAIDAINKAARIQSNTYAQVNSALSKNVKQTQQVTKETNKWANATANVNKGLKKAGSRVGWLATKVRHLASAYVGVMAARAAITTSDTITSAENKFNYLNGGNTATTQETMDKIYSSSQNARTGYSDMMANVSKSITLAGDAFQNNVDNAIRFQEIMAKAYTLGGASAAEQSSSMYQMIQALGSGVLQGDELRSVREGAPLAYKAIEEFAQGVYNSKESLKEMASQGLITSDIVVAAVMDMGATADKAFEETSMTFAQAWQKIKNTTVKAFEPVLQTLNDVLNSDTGQAIIDGIGKAIVFVANGIQYLFALIGKFFNWCAENWDWLKWVIIGALILIGAYYTYLLYQAIAGAIIRIAMWFAEHAAMIKTVFIIAIIIAAMVGLIYIFYQWKNGAIDTCDAIVNALFIVALAILLIGILTGNVVLIIIGIIVALVGIIFMYLEQVMGGIYVVGAFFKNVGLSIANFFVACWNYILAEWHNKISAIKAVGLALWNTLKAVATNIGVAFNNAWYGAKAAFWDFIADCLTGVSKLAPVIDAIAKVFGKGDFSMSGLIESVQGKADSARSNMKDYVSVSDAWNSGMSTYDYQDPAAAFKEGLNKFDTWEDGWVSEAYNNGAAVGAGWKDSINQWGSKFQTGMNLGNMFKNLTEGINEKLGVDTIALPGVDSIGDGSYDPSKVLKGIKGDTGDLVDGMELTNEDLEYLRRIADMEWKKEFTTASITVDMSNYNTINGENDLDGIVTKLADKLYEEMNVVANGVYA